MRATLSSRGDGSALLPAEARAKLETLREQRGELHAVLRDLTDRAEEARLTKHERERDLRILREHDVAGHLSDDDPQVIRARQRIEAADAAMRRLEERRDARSAEWRPLGQLIDRAERWLADLPADAVISPAETEPVKLLKGESPTAAVDRLRRKRRDLLADLQAVDCAPITSTNAKALARAEVERLADKGRPDLFSLIEHGEGIKWPENRVSAPLMGFATSEGAPLLQGHAHATIVDALALTVWLHKDALLAALDAEVDAVADDAAALNDDERGARWADIRASILDVERAEVALIDANPGVAAYRADCDPRALLAVIGPAPVEVY